MSQAVSQKIEKKGKSLETRHINSKVRLETWLHNTMVTHQVLRTDNTHASVLTLFDLFVVICLHLYRSKFVVNSY